MNTEVSVYGHTEEEQRGVGGMHFSCSGPARQRAFDRADRERRRGGDMVWI